MLIMIRNYQGHTTPLPDPEFRPGVCPRIVKNDKTGETGEYKIPPYKGLPGERRGEPCVHPVFSDRLLKCSAGPGPGGTGQE